MRDLSTRQRIIEKIRRELGKELGRYLDSNDTVEIMLNPDGNLWLEQVGGQILNVGTFPPSTAESLICSVASYLNTEINQFSPILECEFPLDGSRFEALIPPLVTGPTFSLRRLAFDRPRLHTYVTTGVASEAQLFHIESAVKLRKNILVVGGTSSGKTTLANAILGRVSELTPEHRLIVIEDTREIRCSSANAVMLRSSAEISQGRLLRATLRLRPDRIVVGEVRGGEALDLLKAWNTGHAGGISTIHANSGRAALLRLEQLVAEVSARPMQALIAEAVQIIIAIQKTENGRRITELLEMQAFDGQNYILSNLE